MKKTENAQGREHEEGIPGDQDVESKRNTVLATKEVIQQGEIEGLTQPSMSSHRAQLMACKFKFRITHVYIHVL